MGHGLVAEAAALGLGWSEGRMELLEKAAKGLGVQRARPAAESPRQT